LEASKGLDNKEVLFFIKKCVFTVFLCLVELHY